MDHPLKGTRPSGRCESCEHFAPVGEIVACGRCDCTRHVAAPREPQTPPAAEAALAAFSEQIDDAVVQLQKARNAELDAEEARDKARWEATLSPDCPPVGVFGGVRTTVAVQQAWIARQIAEEESAYRAKKVVRQAASAHLDKLNSQRSIQQTITKAITGQYQGTGGNC
jgi:hypothetical protein